METGFMNSKNSKTSEPHRFKLDLTDKPNLEDPKKNMALANWVFIGRTSNQNTTTTNSKFLPQLGMILLIYLIFLFCCG